MRGEGPRPHLVMITVILALSVIIVYFPNCVEGEAKRDPVGSVAPPPDIDIIPDQNTHNITTEPGVTPEVITIFGSVRCIMPEGIPPGTECTVQLAVQAHMWEGDVLPMMVFTNEITELAFTYDLNIQEGEAAGKTINVLIYGNWEYDDLRGYGEVSSESVLVNILQYGSVDLQNTYTSGHWEIEIGEAEIFFLRIYNTGNGADTINLRVVEAPEDLMIDLEEDSFIIRRSGFRDVEVMVKQQDGKDQSGVIVFECISSHQGIASMDSIDVTYRTREPSNGLSAAGIFIITFLSTIILVGILFTYFAIRRNRSRKGSNL